MTLDSTTFVGAAAAPPRSFMSGARVAESRGRRISVRADAVADRSASTRNLFILLSIAWFNKLFSTTISFHTVPGIRSGYNLDYHLGRNPQFHPYSLDFCSTRQQSPHNLATTSIIQSRYLVEARFFSRQSKQASKQASLLASRHSSSLYTGIGITTSSSSRKPRSLASSGVSIHDS